LIVNKTVLEVIFEEIVMFMTKCFSLPYGKWLENSSPLFCYDCIDVCTCSRCLLVQVFELTSFCLHIGRWHSQIRIAFS